MFFSSLTLYEGTTKNPRTYDMTLFMESMLNYYKPKFWSKFVCDSPTSFPIEWVKNILRKNELKFMI